MGKPRWRMTKSPSDLGQVLGKQKEELVSAALLSHLAVCPNPSELRQSTDAQPHPGCSESQSPGWNLASLFQKPQGDSDVSHDGEEEESTRHSQGVDPCGRRARDRGKEVTKMMLKFITGPPKGRARMFDD